ncbi:MAG: hypothetical protein AAFU56_07210 [Pseudomonadota bacterium]
MAAEDARVVPIDPSVSTRAGTVSAPVDGLRGTQGEGAGSSSKIHDLAQKRARAEKAKARAQQQLVEKLESLLAVEGDLRQCASLKELEYRVANDLMRAFPSQKIFVLKRRKTFALRLRIAAITSLTSFDGNAPAVVKLEHYFQTLVQQAMARQADKRSEPFVFAGGSKAAVGDDRGPAIKGLPELTGALLPLFDRRGDVHAAAVLLAPSEIIAENVPLLTRLQGAVGHAWLVLLPHPR